MNTVNLVQQQINQAEETLKTDFGFTTQMLEDIGMKAPTAIQYLAHLTDEIEKRIGSATPEIEHDGLD